MAGQGSKRKRTEAGAGDSGDVYVGRPSGYRDAFAKQAERLCALGATDQDLAEFFEVSARTVANWKVQHASFLQALKLGKDASDDRVERSLYQRAMGYSYEAVKIMNVAGEVVKVPYQEHVPPDTTACIFWLKNRRKGEWRDRHEHEHGGPGEFEGMTAADLRADIAVRLGLDPEDLAPDAIEARSAKRRTRAH